MLILRDGSAPFAHWDAFFVSAVSTIIVGMIMTNLVIPFFMRRLWPARIASLSMGESSRVLGIRHAGRGRGARGEARWTGRVCVGEGGRERERARA